MSEELIRVCPQCASRTRQAKAGLSNGVQRYKCLSCQHRYISPAQSRRYSDDLQQKAIQLHEEGLPLRQIAQQLTVSHQSVANWLRKGQAKQAAASALDRPAPLPSKQRPTISDVAMRAGVSAATISNYLNGKGRMAEKTRQRVESAIEDLHFTPSALIRAIRQQYTNILGVFIFGLNHLEEEVGFSLTPPLLGGIYDSAEAAGKDLLLYTGWPQRAAQSAGLDFLNGHTDGLLWINPAMQDPVLERVANAHLPVVGLLTRHVPPAAGYVDADNLGAMHLLVSHLVERGHQRIAYLGHDQSSNFRDRHMGYRQALQMLGLPFDPMLQVMITPRQYTEEECQRVAARLLALPSSPTAIMCSDDGLAQMMGDALQTHGRRIPEDVALTGFDDIPMARYFCGGLTTVRQPLRQIGRLAAESVLGLIAGHPVEACRHTVPATLIIRASTGGA